MSSDVLIRCDKVGKTFCRDLKKSLWYGVKDCATDLFGGRSPIASAELREGEFWANRDVSFELKRGECLGLIGKNGAGKTTLLKMLNGLIKPDTGTIEIHGRVGALIALGAGFDPVLSGRENIAVNATVLGLSKSQIKDRIDDIIDFAELREFIDTPVRNYSSGMQVRLGFAIATVVDPDVLILDEVLAVGDASFRHKCYNRVNKMIRQSAVILVSHSMDSISAVSSCVGMLRRGEFEFFPSVVSGIDAYNKENDVQESNETDGGKVFAIYPPVLSAQLKILQEQVSYGARLDVEIHLDCAEAVEDAVVSFTAVNKNEQSVMNWNTTRGTNSVNFPAGKSTLRFSIDPIVLHDGRYRWNIWISKRGTIEALVYGMRVDSFRVDSPYGPIADIPYLPPPSKFEIVTG
jgi:lipopolysaccharide transport system ATP-binding protein